MTDLAANNRGWIGLLVLTRYGLPILLAGTILFLDISFPLGDAGGVPYVALVLLGLTTSNKNDIFCFAAVGSVLTVVGYYFSSEGGIHWIVLTNRGLALFAIWVTAILCSRQKIDHQQLKKAVEEQTLELSNSEANFRELIEGSDLGIQIGSREKGGIFANQACAELFGYDSVDELLAAPNHQLIAAHDKDRANSCRDSLFDGYKATATFEMDGVRQDGSIVPVQVFMRKIVWEGEDAIQRTFIDLTERKQAEAAEFEAAATLNTALQIMVEGFVVYDADQTVVACNKKFIELAGLPAGCQPVGMSQEEVLRLRAKEGKTAERLTEDVIQRRLKGRQNSSLSVIERKREDGTVFLYHGVPLPGGGYVATYTDVTDLKQAEEQLRQAQKMEAVGQLTGGVAHDFNNLLTVIHGNLELIAGRVDDPIVGDMAQNALMASRRGAELTQRLLAYSRKQTLAPSVIDLDQLITGMTDLMRRSLGESIEIEVTGSDDIWRCQADHAQLESALLNLALNARDAMPQGGKLTIDTSNRELVDADVAALNDVLPGEFVKVSVSDTGAGMPQDVIDHVFEPFFTTKDVGAGSGLGLSMVYGFINQSGGFVTIDSTEGVGTTVNLYLPRSLETTPAVQESPKGKSPVSQGEKVLVVEDDPDVRVLTVHLLVELGYETVEAADGKEALDLLQQTPGIDLLFTDVGLPGGMSGIDVAREAIEQFPNINVLFTSGYADDVIDRHGGIDADAEFVHKPFSKEELAQKLRAAMGQSVH